jgi:hypothetical protein
VKDALNKMHAETHVRMHTHTRLIFGICETMIVMMMVVVMASNAAPLISASHACTHARRVRELWYVV